MTREETIQTIQTKYRGLSPLLNERTRRYWSATEATALGRGGITLVSRAVKIDPKTIRSGIAELKSQNEIACPDRIRKSGAGRKKLTEKDPELLKRLDTLIEPETRGDPESPLRWILASTATIAKMLTALGHKVSSRTIGSLLNQQQYSLQSNRKTEEGTNHPDRDQQFRFISESVKEMQTKNQPVISFDTKKKEIIGNFKNNGKEYRRKGKPREVNTHDFPDPELGKVAPYGIYDISKNEGWVNIGITHDTASFAIESIRRWWNQMGRERYPEAREIMITADCGGSNANRSKLWKVELQNLADELLMTIHVRHFPPGTSKWNKIEHRLFSFISSNWRGRPLIDRATVVNLIANTKTKTGLTVQAVLDENMYETGRKVSKKELEAVNLIQELFHGEWNYRVEPRVKKS